MTKLSYHDYPSWNFAVTGLIKNPDALKTTLQKLRPDLTTIQVDVQGLSGDCVLTSLGGDFADRLGAALTDEDYDLVIILGGTNDLAYKFEKGNDGATEIFEKGLRLLYDYVMETTKASLLVMTVPQRQIDVSKHDSWSGKARESREYLNELILGWAEKQEKRVFSMDLARLMPFPVEHPGMEEIDDRFGEESWWSADGLHMSEKGYDKMGELLAERIAKLLQPSQDS